MKFKSINRYILVPTLFAANSFSGTSIGHIEYHNYTRDGREVIYWSDDSLDLVGKLRLAILRSKASHINNPPPADIEIYLGRTHHDAITIIKKNGSKDCHNHYNLYDGWGISTDSGIISSKEITRIAVLASKVVHGKRSKPRVKLIPDSDGMISEMPDDWCSDQVINQLFNASKKQKKLQDSTKQQNDSLSSTGTLHDHKYQQ